MHLTPIGFISVEKTVFWHISIERTSELVHLVRTAAPYVELSDIGGSYMRIDRALVEVDRKRYRLLMDLREGPRRNDAEFETNVDRHRKVLLGSFRRTALVVKTAAGLLQVKRHLQHDGNVHAAVFMSEEQAMQYLDHVP